MAKVSFKKDVCKGCGLCVGACPKHIISLSTDELNAKGHHPAVCTDMEKCVGCAACGIMCPDCVITVER